MGRSTRFRRRNTRRRGGLSSHMRRRPSRAVRSRRRTKTRTGSKTSSGTKSKSSRVIETRSGSQLSWSKKMMQCPKAQYKYMNLINSQRYYTNGEFQVTSTAGLQGNNYVAFCDPSDLFTIVGFGESQLNVSASTTVVGTHSINFLLKSVSYEIQIANMESCLARLSVYEMLSRKDLYQNPAGGATDIISQFIEGMDEQTENFSSGAGGVNSSVYVGMTPFQCPLLCRYNKILRTTNVTLSPGEVHVHRVKYSPNKFFNQADLQAASTLTAFRNLTLQTLITGVGGVVISGTGNTPTTGTVKLAVVWKANYEFVVAPMSSNGISVANNLLTTVSNTGNMDVYTAAAEALRAAS